MRGGRDKCYISSISFLLLLYTMIFVKKSQFWAKISPNTVNYPTPNIKVVRVSNERTWLLEHLFLRHNFTFWSNSFRLFRVRFWKPQPHFELQEPYDDQLDHFVPPEMGFVTIKMGFTLNPIGFTIPEPPFPTSDARQVLDRNWVPYLWFSPEHFFLPKHMRTCRE